MGVAVELHMDREMDEAMLERIVADCGGYFEEKGMHEVMFALTMIVEDEDGAQKLEQLGITDLALLTGTYDDVDAEDMEWRTPSTVAAAAERLAEHLGARNPEVAFVVEQFAERFGNQDEAARDMALEFKAGEGNWALLESELRLLRKILQWLAANGVPRVTFLQNL